MRTRLASCALAAGLAVASVASGAPECRDRAAAAVQARYEGVRDVSARFEQTTRPVSLGTTPSAPVVSRGRVLLAKPGKMRWTYEQPEPSLVVSDGVTLWLFDPSLREAQKIPAAQGFLTGATAQFLLGAGDMQRDFEVAAVSCEASVVELELVPREPASYEKLYLSVDPVGGDVRRTRIVDLLGNATSVEFQQMRFNTQPKDSEFRFTPPAGVKVIELSE